MTSYETVDELQHVPILDNGEPLVDFVAAGLVFAERHPVFPFPRVHLLRQGVAERLQQAVRLLPAGWTLVLVEGFRTLEVQRMQFEANTRRFRALNPDLSEDLLRKLVEDFSAPPDHPRVPPPHTTGAAFDCHLLDDSGEMVDLVSPYALDDPNGAAFDAPDLTDATRKNRSLLKTALESAGITNYPAEWWHWSYGDQGWAHRGNQPAAVYGRLDYTVEDAEKIQGKPANREEPARAWDF